MDFDSASAQVRELFRAVRPGTAPLSQSTRVEVLPTAEIWIAYPGRKTTGAKTDYRVDLLRPAACRNVAIPFSHTNVALDLYYKANNGYSRTFLSEWLNSLFATGRPPSMPRDRSPTRIPSALLDQVDSLHREIGQKFNAEANELELTFPEMAATAGWIAAQEDINYPQPRFDGRKRPLMVYCEAIHSKALRKEKSREVCFEDVVRRAFAKQRLPLMTGMDYPAYLAR